MEKMKKRAERFGTSVAPSLSRAEDDEKKQKRKERFSLGTTDLSVEVSATAATTDTLYYWCVCVFSCRRGRRRGWSDSEPAQNNSIIHCWRA